ncbi:MAG: hypothetical protein JW885_12945 [Deltaproteobacteria bacterium]|nr:hypothetical protein [Candidatus Zymogenaceae bacterium]
MMNPTERIFAAIEGRETDRVPTFCASLDDWPVQQILGKPLIPPKLLFKNPLMSFVFDKWGPKLKKTLVDPFLDSSLLTRIKGAVELGFDSTWSTYEGTLMIWDSKSLAKTVGAFYDWIEDGHGNMYFMYRGPAVSTPEAYDAWPYHQDIDELAHRAYTYFKKALKTYGDDICIIADVASGAFEILVQMIGFEALAVGLKKNRAYIQKLVDYNTEYIMKTHTAVMDAGIKVILKGDDMAYKTGPMLNPKLMDELFGGCYTNLCTHVHDRGGKIMIHSCGDNTKLFDLFIKWGFDGGHAYENTSNVDIEYEKKTHGDQFTMVGGVGIDYILTERSTPDEVRDEIRYLLRTCGPGGRFLIGPVHDHPDMDMEKVKIMLETVWEDGTYPIHV